MRSEIVWVVVKVVDLFATPAGGGSVRSGVVAAPAVVDVVVLGVIVLLTAGRALRRREREGAVTTRSDQVIMRSTVRSLCRHTEWQRPLVASLRPKMTEDTVSNEPVIHSIAGVVDFEAMSCL